MKVLRHLRPSAVQSRANRYARVGKRRGNPTGKTCLRPYYYVSIHPHGWVYCCCPAWVKFPLGKLTSDTSLAELWNGRAARAFRKAMLSTELERVCNNKTCPYILSGNLPTFKDNRISGMDDCLTPFPENIISDREIERAMTENQIELDYLPKAIDICVDDRCPLTCPSCRDHLITKISPKENELLENIWRLVYEVGPELKQLFFSNGEALYSPFMLKLIRSLNRRDFPQLRVDVLTSGQLCTPSKWKSLGDGADLIAKLSVSIDAASKETYEKVRRGGKWNVLLENLDFIRSLRRSGAIDNFTINFVVAQHNFREMPAFVRLGEKFEVDRVVFTDIQPWTGMDLEYRRAAVHLPGHPEHAEFLEIIDQPECQQGFVLLGTSGRSVDLSTEARVVA